MYPHKSRLINEIPHGLATDQQKATICTFQGVGPHHKVHADNLMKEHGWLLLTYRTTGVTNKTHQWYLNPRGGYTLNLTQAVQDEV